MVASRFENESRSSTNRITLRLQNRILQTLKEEAEQKDIPLNALIASILTKNLIIQNNVNLLPNIIIPSVLFTKTWENLDDKTLEELAKDGATVVKRIFAIQGTPLRLEEVIDKYFAVLAKYCGWFKFSYASKEHDFRLVFETNGASKWTRFIAAYLKSILAELGICLEKESIDDNIIVFEVRNGIH